MRLCFKPLYIRNIKPFTLICRPVAIAFSAYINHHNMGLRRQFQNLFTFIAASSPVVTGVKPDTPVCTPPVLALLVALHLPVLVPLPDEYGY